MTPTFVCHTLSLSLSICVCVLCVFVCVCIVHTSHLILDSRVGSTAQKVLYFHKLLFDVQHSALKRRYKCDSCSQLSQFAHNEVIIVLLQLPTTVAHYTCTYRVVAR